MRMVKQPPRGYVVQVKEQPGSPGTLPQGEPDGGTGGGALP
jgi:hypothetical protein